MATVRLLTGNYAGTGNNVGWSSENGMFDNKYGKGHMFHASDCSAHGQGVNVIFNDPITLDDFIIHTRRDCCMEVQYRKVCLYADEVKIACTPSSDYTPGQAINFMDFRISGTFPITASSFKLQWDGPADCAQIEELFIDYTSEPSTTGPGET